jgi:hypothetical protein
MHSLPKSASSASWVLIAPRRFLASDHQGDDGAALTNELRGRRGGDDLYVRAFDGTTWSVATGTWDHFHLTA